MTNESEGSPFFWKLFGGTIIGTISLLLMIILNHLVTSVNVLRTELTNISAQVKTENAQYFEKFKDDLAGIKSQISALEEFKSSSRDKLSSIEEITKDKNSKMEAAISENKLTLKEIEARIETLKEKLYKLEPKKE